MDRKKIIGFVFGIGVIAMFLLAIGIQEVIKIFLSADPIYLVLAVFAIIMSLIFRATVWYGLFVLADVSVSFKKIIRVYVVSLSAKFAIPVGHIALQTVIAYILSKDSYLNTERVLSVITLGDMINKVSSYVLGLVALSLLLFRGMIPTTYESYISVVILILAFIIVTFLTLWYYQENVLDVVVKFGNIVEKHSNKDTLFGRFMIFEVEDLEDKVLNAYDAIIMIFSDPREVFVLFLIGHLGGIALAGVFLFCGIALGFSFSFSVAVLLVIIGQMGAFLPTPGGLGGVESALVAGCILLINISLVEAATLVLTYRLISYWLVLIGGSGISSIVPYDIDGST